MRARLWNVFVIAAVGWLILMWLTIGGAGVDYLPSVALVGGTPLALLLIGRYVVKGH